MVYRQKYYNFIEKLSKEIINFYGDRLISMVIFGSVASDTFRPDSDIDILIVAENLPEGRVKRVEEFIKNIESHLEEDMIKLSKEGIYITLSPVFKTPEEVYTGSPLFLDMTENVKILYDKNDFFKKYLEILKIKLKTLGARKIYTKGGYYWELKPDYKFGEIIEL
ncbi:nucleotidyltransferase domain-containing protein [Thermodesulfovibrio sp.]|uniref:nucleotidyltransferase domain-containing protein n=1 Tax=Thermodesulfovibrio sp. TaxID=2067987 RepID=UPI003C7C745F